MCTEGPSTKHPVCALQTVEILKKKEGLGAVPAQSRLGRHDTQCSLESWTDPGVIKKDSSKSNALRITPFPVGLNIFPKKRVAEKSLNRADSVTVRKVEFRTRPMTGANLETV